MADYFFVCMNRSADHRNKTGYCFANRLYHLLRVVIENYTEDHFSLTNYSMRDHIASNGHHQCNILCCLLKKQSVHVAKALETPLSLSRNLLHCHNSKVVRDC